MQSTPSNPVPFRSILILSSRRRLVFWVFSSLQALQPQFYSTFHIPMRATCPAHPIMFDLIILLIFGEGSSISAPHEGVLFIYFFCKNASQSVVSLRFKFFSFSVHVYYNLARGHCITVAYSPPWEPEISQWADSFAHHWQHCQQTARHTFGNTASGQLGTRSVDVQLELDRSVTRLMLQCCWKLCMCCN
jgi:hypothetical protein